MEESSIWTEKYRPKSFADIRGQEEIVRKLSAFVGQKNLPHLLFAGPAGVGKSTLALVLARSFFGERYRDNFLELN
ncbi:MAG TPA: Replication factor C small subunit, partial [Candidatus Nanoarchaeia archaeon]|nr:Replication factor C small subunit [Candidatus Nanoarchaeia archaeon]